jgi:DNA-binding PadR family transcriptional regulator
MEMVNASEGSLKRGAIYVTLQRMETKGLLESKQEKRNPPEIGIPRRLYSTTERGLRACLAYDVAQAVMTSEDGKPLDRDTIDELIQQALFDRGLPKDSGGKGLSPNP